MSLFYDIDGFYHCLPDPHEVDHVNVEDLFDERSYVPQSILQLGWQEFRDFKIYLIIQARKKKQ